MECSICLEEIEEIEQGETSYLITDRVNNYVNAVSLSCGHVFHKECIAQWLKNTPNCPYCRKYFVNTFNCYIKKKGDRLSSRGVLYIDEDNYKDITINVKNLLSKSYTLYFNRFNIVSVHMTPKGKLYLKCFKTLHHEEETFEITVCKKNFREHVFESFNKVVRHHYVSTSRITPSVISEDEQNYSNMALPETHEFVGNNTHNVEILSNNSSFSSLYSLRSIEV